MSLFDSINETNRAYCLHHVKRSMFLYKSMNYTLKNELYGFFTDLMDFVHNPYRCGPLRVGRYGLGLHLSPSSRLRTMPFLDTQNYPPESVSSPPAQCPALPGESSVEMMLLSIRMTALKKDVVTTLIAHHGTIRLCTVGLCCKHALICCGMSRTHDMMIYNILLNSSRGFLLISCFKRFLCRHCYNSEG